MKHLFCTLWPPCKVRPSRLLFRIFPYLLFASVLPGMRPLLLIGGFPKYPPSCRSPGSAFQPTVRTACFRLTVRKPIPCVRALLSVSSYSILAYSRSADTPFVLFALLLLSAPDGFTSRSLFAFDGFGERTWGQYRPAPL